jgi:hypothetical protein
MNDIPSNEQASPSEEDKSENRRLFLQGMGKWSGAAIMAAVSSTWLGSTTAANAGWLNRRGGGGAGWINGGGGGGGWINGGGSWINRRTGGGSWINRH